MANDILKGYGSDRPSYEKPRASSGGTKEAKPLAYSPPKGPTEQMRQGPGLGGNVHPCGSQRDK